MQTKKHIIYVIIAIIEAQLEREGRQTSSTRNSNFAKFVRFALISWTPYHTEGTLPYSLRKNFLPFKVLSCSLASTTYAESHIFVSLNIKNTNLIIEFLKGLQNCILYIIRT